MTDSITSSEIAAAPLDGRAARSERTRQALVDAHLELLNEGDLSPTAERIAERAGCSPRSVFKHFPDREELFARVSELQWERIQGMVERIPPDGALEQRLDAFVAQRARVCEAIAPVRRAAMLSEPFSAAVEGWLGRVRDAGGAEVKRVFGPELDAIDDGARDAALAAMAAVASWSSWEALRRHQRLSSKEAARAMRYALEALLRG